MDCFICGAKEEDGIKMHKVISETKIVNVCENCIGHTSLPKIKTVDENEIIKANRQSNWRERVNKQVDEKPSFKISNSYGVTLRDVVERKMNPLLSEKMKPKPDLIKNFNWEVLKARRQKKLTQMKLGTLVGESEFTIRMLERGIVPENYHHLIKKIEEILKINIFTEEYKKLHLESTLTIQDLKEMNDPEELPQEPYWRRMMNKIFSKKSKKEFVGENSVEMEEEKQVEEDINVSLEEKELDLTNFDKGNEELKNKKELTPEEINALIFGSKKK